MRILVAHMVGRQRTGGMSRLMGRAHDVLADAGHHVDYLTSEDVPPALRGRLARLAFPLLVRRAAVDAARRGKPYDVVTVHEPHGAAIAGNRRGLRHTAVVVMTHGVERRGWEIALAHPPSRPSMKTRLVYPSTSLWMSAFALRRADHVVCLNEQDRGFLGRRFGIDPARVTAVTPGADPIFGHAAATRSYGSARRLLFAGTWLPRKGATELARAFELLVERGHDVELAVLGAGVPDGEVLRAFGPRSASRVRILGSGDDALMASALAGADVFVLPSLFEGTPLTLIEAMWSGLPIVTTRTAGMQDVVRHEETGLLVPPGDDAALAGALARLVTDGPLRRALGTAAHRVAGTSYTWANTAAAFHRAYEQARLRHDASTR
jgi:glycosyltransferase involved in cell wall biosynthesis